MWSGTKLGQDKNNLESFISLKKKKNLVQLVWLAKVPSKPEDGSIKSIWCNFGIQMKLLGDQ